MVAQILCLNNINPIPRDTWERCKDTRQPFREGTREKQCSELQRGGRASPSHHITAGLIYWPDDKNGFEVSNLAGGRPGRLATEDNSDYRYIRYMYAC